MDWIHKLVKTESVDVETLMGMMNPENPREHPEHQMEATEELINAIGFIDEIKVSVNSKRILNGHARIKIALASGQTSLPVNWYDLTEDEERLALEQYDATTYEATYNPDKLRALMEKTKGIKADKSALQAIMERLKAREGIDGNGADSKPDPGPQGDKAAQLAEKWGTRTGQVWQLGAHRLAVGDCTDKAVVENVMNGAKYDSLITAPPFFTPATHYQSRVKHQRKFSDLSTLTGFFELILGITGAYKKDTSHVVVFCNADSYAVFYPVMFSRFDKTKSLVWDKGHVGLGRIFRHQHELMIWGRDNGHYFVPSGKLYADVMTYEATPSKDRDHPVEKPIPLLRNLIEPLTPESGIVFDPFLGAGPTLIAAESTNRVCYGIDMESSYVAVVLERWQQITRQDPVLLSE